MRERGACSLLPDRDDLNLFEVVLKIAGTNGNAANAPSRPEKLGFRGTGMAK
jgi:hypothetical protein